MSKDIKKALEHCAEWKCDNCPNGDELGSGEIVCRGRLLPQVLEYIADLEAKLAEREKNFVVANNLRKNSDEVLLNYKTEKYGLDKTIQELRKVKLSFPEKEWYYKGFENCERQMSSHIADLTLEVKELKQQLAESEEKVDKLETQSIIDIDHISYYQSQYLEIKEQLAEKEKEIEQLKEYIGCKGCIDLISKTHQDKISFAVEQLEKVKKLCKEKFDWWENSEWEGNVYDKFDVSNAYFDIEANIDEQIAELTHQHEDKGEPKD